MIDKKKIFRKHLFDLMPFDFEAYPVWENDLSFEVEDGDERIYVPVKELPVNTLRGRIIGLPVQLANGKNVWAQLSSIYLGLPRTTEQLLSIAVERGGKWFYKTRYFNPGYSRHGPDALAEFLGMKVDGVFPIKYDLRPHVIGHNDAVKGFILKEPRERLTKQEIRKLPKRTPQEEEEFREEVRMVEELIKMPKGTPQEEAELRAKQREFSEKLTKMKARPREYPSD